MRRPPPTPGTSILVAHPSAELYGSDRVLLESVDGFVRKGWHVVVAIPSEGPLLAALTAVGADVRMCPSPVLRKNLLTPKGFLAAAAESVIGAVRGAALLRHVAPDVVFVNTMTLPLWLVLAAVARRPSVLHVHEAERSASAVLRAALALPSLLTARIISNSRFSTEALTSSLPRYGKTVDLVYNAVPGPDVPTEPRSALSGAVKLLYVGRLSARKGVDVIIEAMSLLSTDGPDCELTILGAVYPGYEWYEEQLKASVAEHRLEDRVRFVGFDDSVWSYYAATDIALIPSRLDEPFGNTAVEAALAQRPAVISDTSGLREASGVARASVLVEPGDARALAAGIVSIVDDWARYRENALLDADDARIRHDPALYQDRVSAVVRKAIGRS